VSQYATILAKLSSGQDSISKLLNKVRNGQVDQSVSLSNIAGSSPRRNNMAEVEQELEQQTNTIAVQSNTVAPGTPSAPPLQPTQPKGRKYPPSYDAGSLAKVQLDTILQVWNTHGLAFNRYTPNTPQENKSKIRKVVTYTLAVVDESTKLTLKSVPPDNLCNPTGYLTWCEELKIATANASAAVMNKLLELEGLPEFLTRMQEKKDKKNKDKPDTHTAKKPRKAVEKDATVSAIDKRIADLVSVNLINKSIFA